MAYVSHKVRKMMEVSLLILLPLNTFAIVGEWKGLTPLTRIVEGFDCVPEEYPYLVSIQTIKYKHFCGGSLYSERLVLTAAHCCDKTLNMYVFAGMSVLKRKIVQKARVSRVFKHPEYSLHPMKNDVCMMELRTPIFQTDTIQFVQLATPEMWENKRLAECRRGLVLGFGYRGQKYLNGTRKYPNKVFKGNLQCVNLKMLLKEVCEFAISMVDDSIFCAVDETAKGRDSCQKTAGLKMFTVDFQGDSGGPYMCNNVQYGVVSSGFGCGLIGYPSLYARLDIHTAFFESVQATNREIGEYNDAHAVESHFFFSIGIGLFIIFVINI